MFNKLSTSFNLVKISFSFIKRDWELLVYSIMSLLASIAILITFTWVDFYTTGYIEKLINSSDSWETISQWIIYWALFLYYFIFSFITFFFNTAIITSVQRRIDWKDNKLWDWLRDSIKYLKEIFIWSIINAIVTTILKIIQNRFPEDSIIWRIIVWIIWWLWNIMTFFSFPLMIINKMWTKEAIKESANLFKKTWWERAIISVWIWLMFFFIYLALFIIAIGIIFSGLIFTWIAILFLGILFLSILAWTCDTIIKTILLNYAQTWLLPEWLNENQKNVFENIAVNKN